jgi:hypothetical protein
MPFSKELSKKYKDNIVFIYLSFDKNKTAWLNKMRALDIVNNSYLVEGDFNSPLAEYLKINSIPRYILIDKKGNIVFPNLPRPSDPKLISILDRYAQ